jgi:hypothetical protein
MDCEKFENTLLDELYDELDEVTSAAAKRHAGGCSRCASLLSGFKATRRVAVLDMIEPPADLEDRILAAAKEAQKVVPIGQKMSTVVSRAGSWAMRPQTAMAALFLLMIGSSALLLRGKHASQSSVAVSDEGEPVPSATTAMVDHPAAPGAPAAKAVAAAAPSPTALASSASGPAFASAPPPPPGDLAGLAGLAGKGGDMNLDRRGVASGSEWSGTGPAGKVNLPSKSDGASKLYASNDDKKEITNAAAPAGAPPAHSYDLQAERGGGGGAASGASAPAPATMAPSKPMPPRPAPKEVAANAYGQGRQAQSPPSDGDFAAAPAAQARGSADEPAASPFDTAMAAYNGGDYATATTLFDQVAASGDANAALWAARSVREGSGCPSAAARFDQLAARAGTATATRYDAMFDAGRCYKAMSQSDRARAYFNVLLGVPRYVDRAKSELASMGPMVAARKAAQAQSSPQQAQQPPPNNVQQYPAAAAPPVPASPPAQQQAAPSPAKPTEKY